MNRWKLHTNFKKKESSFGMANVKHPWYQSCYMHAKGIHGGRLQRKLTASVETQSFDEGCGKKRSYQVVGCRVVYPISDNKWVSLVECVPKKGKITVVKQIMSWSPQEQYLGEGYVWTTGNIMKPQGRTIIRYLSLIKCWKGWLAKSIIVSLMGTKDITRFSLHLRIKKR